MSDELTILSFRPLEMVSSTACPANAVVFASKKILSNSLSLYRNAVGAFFCFLILSVQLMKSCCAWCVQLIKAGFYAMLDKSN